MFHSLGIGLTHSQTRSNSIGQDNSSAAIRKAFSMLPTPVDFPGFLTYVTSLKSQISTPEDLANAFISFDESDSGYIDFEDLKNDLMNSGPQRMTEEQVNVVLKGFVEKTGKNKGRISYMKFLDEMMGGQGSAT